MIDNALQRLTEWIPADPVNLLIGAGMGAIAFGYFVVVDLHNRNLNQWLEARDQAPEAAIHYSGAGSSGWRGLLVVLVAIAFWLIGMWDRRSGTFDLTKLAIIGLPTLVLLLAPYRRLFRKRPGVALYADGILVDSWRGETMVPWEDVAYVVTDPAESTGYRPNTHLRLLVGRKDGRKWRYSEHDFGDDAPSQFETIVGLALRHIR